MIYLKLKQRLTFFLKKCNISNKIAGGVSTQLLCELATILGA